MLKQRIITAVLLAPVLLGAIVYGNPYIFAFVVFVIQAASIFEWLKINKLNNFQALVNALVLSFFTWYLTGKIELSGSPGDQMVHQNLGYATLLCYSVVWLLALLWLKNYRWGYENTATQLMIKALLGVLAIMLFGFSLNELYASGMGKWVVLSIFLLIWIADVGAYFSGKTIGKHKLAINISPGKTWEGVMGAQILVAVYAVMIAPYIGLSLQQALLIMISVALFSVIGDLAASLGKRQAQIKDSSNLLPGHGGFIDRFDSMIAAAPLFFLLSIFL